MEFQGIEVPGLLVQSYVDAFKLVRHVPHDILTKHGVGARDVHGNFVLESGRLYSFAATLAAVRELAAVVGPRKMFEAGAEIPKHAVIPPGASEIKGAMQVLDAGYHMNHRKDGRPMFDMVTGRMTEGIGHYKCASIAGREIVMDVDVPYPCDLDRGILQTWARRFEPTAQCVHLDPQTCRSKRAARCRYAITWR